MTPYHETATWLLAATCLAGCLDSFQTSSRYQDMRYLCRAAERDIFEAQVEDCRQARATGTLCGGVLSLQGLIDGVEVTLETELVHSNFRTDAGMEDMGAELVSLYGTAPYFNFRIQFDSLGARVDLQPDLVPRTWTYDATADDRDDDLADTWVEASLRLSVASESRDRTAPKDAGMLSVSLSSSTELRGDFRGQYSDDQNDIEACFHAFFDPPL